MSPRVMFASVAVALVLVLAGCDSDPPAATPSKPASAVPTSPAEREVAESEALAAYDGLWQAMARAGEVPDPDAPELRQYAAEDALARVVGALVNYREKGQVSRGAPVTDARVVSATPEDDPTEVHVVDCGDSTNWTTHDKETGAQVSPDPRGRRHITAAVEKIDGSWKVTTFDVGDIGSC